jgi:hypothetical protein
LRVPQDVWEKFDKNVRQRFSSQNEAIVSCLERSIRDASHVATSKHEQLRRNEHAAILAETVIDFLAKDQSWASHALLKAELGRPGEWTFGDRFDHFIDEKEFIAQRFAPWLLRRVVHLQAENRTVWLIFDSGTTIYWPFRVLLRELKTQTDVRNLTILTNNIPGIEQFFSVCRPEKNPTHVTVSNDVAARVTCKLLPGDALWEYDAVTGEETNAMLIELRRKNPKAIFIGLTTGNWVQLAGRPPANPVCLARGSGHPEFKKELMASCDEVYVLSPLGKLIANKNLSDINRAFKLDAKQQDPQKKPYLAVSLPTARNKTGQSYRAPTREAQRVSLVSTTRENSNALLIDHAREVKRLLVQSVGTEAHINYPIGQVPNLVYAFDKFSHLSSVDQMPIDLPHPYTQDLAADFFGIHNGPG